MGAGALNIDDSAVADPWEDDFCGRPGRRRALPRPSEEAVDEAAAPPGTERPDGEGVRLGLDDDVGVASRLPPLPWLRREPPEPPVAVASPGPVTTFLRYPSNRHHMPIRPVWLARVSRYRSSLRRSNMPR